MVDRAEVLRIVSEHGIVAYYAAFAHLTGTVQAGIFLSQMVYWSARSQDGWVFRTQAELTEETGLSRFEQETARKRLRGLGVIQEERRGVPARLYYKVDFDRLSALLLEHSTTQLQSSVLSTSKRDCEKVANRRASRQQSNKEINRDYVETEDLGPPGCFASLSNHPPKGGVRGEEDVSPQTGRTDFPSKGEKSKKERVCRWSEEDTERFESFWKTYQRRVAKAKALQWWQKHRPGPELTARILEAVRRQAQSEQWRRDNGRYIPHPITWLNQRRWEDEWVDGAGSDECGRAESAEPPYTFDENGNPIFRDTERAQYYAQTGRLPEW